MANSAQFYSKRDKLAVLISFYILNGPQNLKMISMALLLCQNHWPLRPPHFSCIILCLQLVWLYFSSMYTHILNTNFYCFFYNSLQKMRYGMSNLPVTYSIHSVVQWSVSCQKKVQCENGLSCKYINVKSLFPQSHLFFGFLESTEIQFGIPWNVSRH